MRKNCLHILVLMAFVVSTMPALAMPGVLSSQHGTIEHDAFQETMLAGNAHVAHQMAHNESCCESDCQCAVASCTQTQTLYDSHNIAHILTARATLFVAHNEQYDNNISYLLKHPPRV